MGLPNWGNLYSKGRCKAIGVSWSEEELNAIYELKIPVEYVRNGVLTIENYENLRKKDEEEGKPIERLEFNELRKRAKELSITFTSETPADTLIKLIHQKEDSGNQMKKDNEKEELITALLEAGIEVDKRWSVETLKDKIMQISEKLAKTPAETPNE